ncbi:MAG: hypothetical protein WDO71_14350 [Bacteroidota bacterium]
MNTPKPQNIFDQVLGRKDPAIYTNKIKEEMGAENYRLYLELKRVKEMTNSVQARLPFQFFIH